LINNQKGAMDSILVTLLLVVIGAGLVIGLLTYFNEQKVSVQTKASAVTQQVLEEAGQ
jgi:predicted negative regulator of RcsB-dependent stress response